MSGKRQDSSSIVPAKKQKCLSSKKKYFRINDEFIRKKLELWYCSSDSIINLLIENKFIKKIKNFEDDDQNITMVRILDETLRYNLGTYFNINIFRSILLEHKIISEVNISLMITINNFFF